MLQLDGTSLGWTIVRVPFDPAQVWPRRKGLRVRGTVNEVAVRTSLFRTRDGGCILLVNKQTQKNAAITLGSVADVVGANPPYVRTFEGGLLGTVGGTAIAPGVPGSAVEATVAANQAFDAGFSAAQLSCASPPRTS